jgi:hypothetical protein
MGCGRKVARRGACVIEERQESDGGPRSGGRFSVAWVAAGLSVLLCWSSLSAGMQTEDFGQRTTSLSRPGWGNLFGSGDNPTAANHWAKDHGGLPWIAVDKLHIAMWRPLASLTHHLDYRRWPNEPLRMHIHSLVWLVAVVLAVGAFYRRFAPSAWVFGLATLFYAVDDARGEAVGWLANRSALVSTLFAVLALIAHDRWRRDRWKPGGVLVAVLAWVALQGAETAVGAFGYAAAYTLTLDRGSWRARSIAMAPWVIAAFAWMIPYRILGYGVYGSGAYVDPLRQPLEFGRVALERGPVLLIAQITGFSADQLVLSPEPVFLWWALIAALATACLVPIVRRSREARFFALGMVLSAAPACGTSPSDRLLTLVSLGGMGLVATLIVSAANFREGRASWIAKVANTVAALSLFWMHGVLSPRALPGRARGLAVVQSAGTDQSQALLDGVSRGQKLVIVAAPDFFWAAIVVGAAKWKGALAPEFVRTLYGGSEPVLVRRPRDRVLVIEAPHGFVRGGMNRVYRGRSYPMHAGETQELTGVDIAVVRVDASGEATEVEFRFDVPLEDPGLVWKRWDGPTPVPFALPKVGESVIVPPFGPVTPAPPPALG